VRYQSFVHFGYGNDHSRSIWSLTSVYLVFLGGCDLLTPFPGNIFPTKGDPFFFLSLRSPPSLRTILRNVVFEFQDPDGCEFTVFRRVRALAILLWWSIWGLHPSTPGQRGRGYRAAFSPLVCSSSHFISALSYRSSRVHPPYNQS